MSWAIKVENISKKYILGRRSAKTLRDAVANYCKSLGTRFKGRAKLDAALVGPEDFWALKDVCFDIAQGDRVGIIGRNGAGKSTMLKILSRITEPTRGRVTIWGRVASLLEVGTGFHPELTGRENIYLNGSILGMSKFEITRKFDEIVAFSEIERFLDTPVKHYSSGMYVRLAFAVAAHLEPEILIVDEVLAVGDIEFQRKCLGKMESAGKEGRTVLFVSHNLGTIRRLCNKAVLLQAGQVAYDGTVEGALEEYQKSFAVGSSVEEPGVLFKAVEPGPGVGFWIESIEILDESNLPKLNLLTWDFVKFRIKYGAREKIEKGSGVVMVQTIENTPLMLFSSMPDQCVKLPIKPGLSHFDCIVPQWPLAAGEYLLRAGLAIPSREWLCQSELAKLLTGPKDVFDSGLPPESVRYLVATPYTMQAPPE